MAWLGNGTDFKRTNGNITILDEVKFLNINYSNGTQTMYDAGTLVDSTVHVYVPNPEDDRFTIGGSIGQLLFNGDIGEIIIFDRELSPTERTSIEAYLSNKWGIDLS